MHIIQSSMQAAEASFPAPGQVRLQPRRVSRQQLLGRAAAADHKAVQLAEEEGVRGGQAGLRLAVGRLVVGWFMRTGWVVQGGCRFANVGLRFNGSSAATRRSTPSHGPHAGPTRGHSAPPFSPAAPRLE
jgi:hypothetical protein